MGEVYTRLQNCLDSVRRKTDFKPQLALVLGSGLGDYAADGSGRVVSDECGRGH